MLVRGRGLLEVHPRFRRRGIGSRSLEEAHTLGLLAAFDFTRQAYTRAGWAVVRRYLQRAGQSKELGAA